MISRQDFLHWLLAAIFGLLGLFLIALVALPYGTLKAFFDSLLPDHNFNVLKPWNAGVFKVIFGVGGAAFLGLAVMSGLRRWNRVGKFLRRLWADTCCLCADIRPHKDELGFLAVVLVVMLLAIVFRMEHIYSSLHHDEAYTYVAFGRSLFSAITDYHLPNNHIFHSILLCLSTQIFGIQPWAVRLPAFMAGVLIVPAAYWLAKRIYDRWTALGAALLAAWFPALTAYSNNARGYTLVALFTLLILVLGDYVLKEKNFFAWGLISLFSALGFYTVPVMMFPFGVLFVWLLVENIVEGPGPYKTKWEFTWFWLAAGLGTAVLTLLFYLPIFIFTGPEKVFTNGFVAPLPWGDLLETLSSRFTETWAEWSFRIPPIIILLFVTGFILSLIFHWRISNRRVPVQLATLLWIVILLLVQRPNAWSKVWVFLQPLFLIWVAAGILGLLQKIRLKFVRGYPLAAVVFSLALFAGILQAARLIPQLPGLWGIKGNEESAVLFVKSRLQQADLIIVAPPDDAPVWYYSELHDIPDASFDPRSSIFERAMVLVDTIEGQTPATVIAAGDPELAILDPASALLLDTFGKIQVFEVLRR
jgi:hypothetical protein